MLKILITCTSVLALTACSYSEANPLPSSAVRIETGEGLGSGTKIGKNRVLTAAHVVKDAKELTIINENGAAVKGRVLFLDEEKDLALVEASPEGNETEVECSVRPPGTEFEMNGNPLGMQFIRSWGRISSKPQSFGDFKSGYIVDGTIIMGVSGSGAIDNSGKLIGVISAIRLAPMQTGNNVLPYVPAPSGFGFIVDGPTICEFLEKDA